jgi:hypothetical protein
MATTPSPAVEVGRLGHSTIRVTQAPLVRPSVC